jgi:dephospho-CoA kinase
MLWTSIDLDEKFVINVNKLANKRPRVVALTGCLGSGKSAALKIFASLGAETISADILAREVVNPGSEALKKIAEYFGPDAIDKTGSLNRSFIASKVFDSPEKKKALEDITHPLIRQRSSEIIRKLKEKSPAPLLIVYEIPLFFESAHKYPEIDVVIVISVPENIAIERVVREGRLNEQDIKKRLKNQISILEKMKKADIVIDNSGNLTTLEARIKEVYDKLVT